MIDVSIRLRRAIYVDDLLIVQRILRLHPSCAQNPDPAGNTSLHLAALHSRPEIAAFLVEDAGHELDGRPSTNNNGDTPLHVASAEGHKEVAHFLVKASPRHVDVRDRGGLTPLMMAAKGGWEEVVKMLLDMGADPEAVDGLGNTALHFASAYGHLSVIRTLIEHGAPADRPNRQGWKPINYACTFEAEAYYQQLLHELELRRVAMSENAAARARAATPVFGRSERVLPGRQRASSGS